MLICDQGNTPLVRINSLSNALGVEILGKAEVRVLAIWRCRPELNLSPRIPSTSTQGEA